MSGKKLPEIREDEWRSELDSMAADVREAYPNDEGYTIAELARESRISVRAMRDVAERKAADGVWIGGYRMELGRRRRVYRRAKRKR